MPTYKEMRELFDKSDKERKEQRERWNQDLLKELEKQGAKPFDYSKIPPKRCDHPNTMEDSTATIVWLVAMFISLLFKGGLILCIIETIIWLKFITRYKK